MMTFPETITFALHYILIHQKIIRITNRKLYLLFLDFEI